MAGLSNLSTSDRPYNHKQKLCPALSSSQNLLFSILLFQNCVWLKGYILLGWGQTDGNLSNKRR